MRLFPASSVAQRLCEDRVSEGQKMLYVLLCFLINAVFASASVKAVFYTDAELNLYDQIVDVATVIFVAASILVAFRINQRGDGERFVERYACLYLPVGLEAALLAVLLFFFLGILSGSKVMYDLNAGFVTDAFNCFAAFSVQVYFFLRMNGCIKTASRRKP